MKIAPTSAVQAIMLAKRIASRVDPGFASVDIPTFGRGAPVERANSGLTNGGYAAGGSPDGESNGTAGLSSQAGELSNGRGISGSGGLLQAPDGQRGSSPLEGLPQQVKIPATGQVISAGPAPHVRDAAASYMQSRGLPYRPPTKYVRVDPERAAMIAKAYEEMPHDPEHPLVKASYDALIDEVTAQYQHAKAHGLKVDFWDPDAQEDPYAASPRLANEDIRHNNHMFVFPTSHGYGQDGFGEEDIKHNPMLRDTGERWGGKPVLANDLFRVVHDYFGHAKEGLGFRDHGEENAWLQHSAMFSPLARIALTGETRGQNSHVNYGPHGEHNRSANSLETRYAPQKTGAIAPWVLHSGVEDQMESGDIQQIHDLYAAHGQGKAEGGEVGPSERKANLDRFMEGNHPDVPKVMYHGTNRPDFNSFKLPGRSGSGGNAIFTTTSPAVASGFARSSEGARVMPVHVSAKNPWDAQNEEHKSALKRFVSNNFHKLYPGALFGVNGALSDVDNGDYGVLEKPAVRQWMRQRGHDGFWTQEQNHEGAPRTLAVFDPSQIKSATGNNGNFDSEEDDITKSEGGEVDAIDTDDEGKTVPESAKTLEHQRQLLLEGRRKAVMYPKGGNTAPEAPDGAGVTITPHGTFHFNPALVTEEQIHEASRQGRLNEILGMGAYSKKDIAKRIERGERPVAIVARDSEGHEVVSAAGTHATADEQIEAMRHQVPEGGSIGAEHPEQVIRDRQAVHRAAGGEVGDSNYLNSAGLYSTAASAADNLKQAKGRPEDMLRAISTSPGVKADELKWSGANDAFANQPAVTKDDLSHYFHMRAPNFPEKTYRHRDFNWGAFDEEGPEDDFSSPRPHSDGPTKFHDYATPGGENYRELLMHLPDPEKRQATDEERKRGYAFSPTGGTDAVDKQGFVKPMEQHYKSSHWSQPNVIAHLRMSDRYTPENQKALHLEELQSDWGQDARKYGHGLSADEDAKYKDLHNERFRVHGLIKSGIKNDTLSDEDLDKLTQQKNSIFDQMKLLDEKRENAVATGPFINKTENWTDLGLKRALTEAAKNGYSKLVWTPGEEQAKRYGLSRHIGRVDYEHHPDLNSHDIVAYDPSGRPVSNHYDTRPEDIEKHLGKEIAEKILNGEGRTVRPNEKSELDGSTNTKRIIGLNTKIGGEGMEGYYDKLLPNRLIKLAREHDPEASLGQHDVNKNDRGETMALPGLTITPRMRESILKRGFKAYADGGGVGYGRGGSPDMDRVREALAKVASPFSADPKSVNAALLIARSLKTPMGGETGTGSFYNVKQPMGVSDVSAAVGSIPGVSPKDVQKKSWEALHKEGGTLLNLGGDRSALGRLTHINGKELSWPVDLHAGTSYMREPNKGQVWANNPSHATALQKVIRTAAKNGPVFGAFGPMGPRAVDSSHNMFDALMAQVPSSNISKADAKAFDESIMRGEHIKGTDDKSVAKRASAIKYLEAWPGILSPKAASEFARNLPGGHRSDIVKYMDTALWAKRGFPAVGVTRAAISDPDIRGASGNMLGHRIVKFDPDATDVYPKSFEHSTYSTDTPGEYWGDVPLVQRQYAMPDVIDQMLSKPTKSGKIIHPYSPYAVGRSTARKLFEEQKQTQPINDRMLESVQQGLERQKDYGLNKGGAVNKAIGVAMKAQKRR